MPSIDSITREASKLLTRSGISLEPVFPTEVDDGFRWGVAHLVQAGRPDKLQVLVGVPANGRFTADELATAGRDGATISMVSFVRPTATRPPQIFS